MGEKRWLSWTASSLSAAADKPVIAPFDAQIAVNVPKIQKNTAPISGSREFSGIDIALRLP
jgi:hypothetical protein